MKVRMKLKVHMIIMSVIGILMAAVGLLLISNIAAFLMLGVLPMVCIITFLATGLPAFGIAYTALFFINRVEILMEGTLLARGVILLLLGYFIYVDYMSIKERKGRAKDAETHITAS